MKLNMGALDRVLRILIAAIIGYLYATGAISGPLGLALVILSCVFVITGLIGYCPLYAPFGMSTRKRTA